ncbi:alanine dehydrogenase [Halobacillus andaensis]|uniref:Alanine dehydrogenase n=1 Tax=Halobacillus andaensis TaxID=1176239 RepID=A0A917EUE9_HALAA|nr:alanine dehydrogenase [Halobacillus andaensis]MBP2004004.1 alanine dehydrogenase [Halobacillus andaensis]GGF15072.1 alanine dehydrogenase [Halobacillus andaensis]
MRIGIPKEIKNNENRVAITPAGVLSLTNEGHDVLIETTAGVHSGFTDEQYEAMGARIVGSPAEAWAQEMVIKVKEPIAEEYKYFYDGLILFAYLHLAAEKGLTKALVEKNVTAIAYETVQLQNGMLPLLTPMSEVAGRMATQIGAQFLEKPKGGKGVLLGGVPGVKRGKVTVIGGGVVGTNAVKIAIGLGADVNILDLNPERLRQLDDLFGTSVNTLMSNPLHVEEAVRESDLVVGAVLIPGAKAPKLVSENMVSSMKEGSVIVDVAVDQGGIVETVDQVTTHDDPTYVKHGVVHYAVGNMPGAVPKTSTLALTNVTIPYASQIAKKGYEKACLDDKALLKGLNVVNGSVTYKEVAHAHQMEYMDVKQAIQMKSIV